MKHALLTTVIASVLFVSGASAQTWPQEFSYTFYIKGEPAGKSATKITKTGDRYVLESHTTVDVKDFALDLKTRTEIDRESFHVLEYSFKGKRNDVPLEGDMVIEAENVTGFTVENEQQYPVERISMFPTVLVLEDYVVAHEAIIARICAAQQKETESYGVFLGSSTMMTTAEIMKASEIAFESEIKEAICTKLIISIEGSSPFVSYYDAKRGLPVYLAFPASATEIFLDEFFGGKPVSRYRP